MKSILGSTRTYAISEIIFPNLAKIRKIYQEGEIRSNLANVRPVERYLSGVKFPLNTIECLFER